MGRKIQIVNSREGKPIVCVNDIYLHSKYFPSREAEKFISANEKIYKDKDIVLVYGLGFGYHVKELIKRVSENCRIYVFDADEEIIKITEQLGILDELKKDNRIEIITNYSQEFLRKLSYIMTLVDDSLISKASVKLLPDKYKDLKELLEGYNIAKISVERFKDQMKKNYEVNAKLKLPNIGDFFRDVDFAGETIIIAAAGPSLDYNISALKEVNKKCRIFSVGSALITLLRNEIKPDMVCIIDCQEVVYNQLRGYEDLDVPLCFLSTASRWAVAKYTGPKYMFYNEENEDGVVINTGKTVAVATLDIAIKGGAKQIIFVGQDLAYLNHKTHTDAYVEIYGSSNSVPEEGIYKKVLGVDGSMLNTTAGYLYFKRQIEREIEENPHITFINCSKGARIEGTIEVELTEAVNRFS